MRDGSQISTVCLLIIFILFVSWVHGVFAVRHAWWVMDLTTGYRLFLYQAYWFGGLFSWPIMFKFIKKTNFKDIMMVSLVILTATTFFWTLFYSARHTNTFVVMFLLVLNSLVSGCAHFIVYGIGNNSTIIKYSFTCVIIMQENFWELDANWSLQKLRELELLSFLCRFSNSLANRNSFRPFSLSLSLSLLSFLSRETYLDLKEM